MKGLVRGGEASRPVENEWSVRQEENQERMLF